MPSLVAGGPSYYPLRAEPTIGGEVYERMLLERLPAHGVEVVVGLPREADISNPPQGWRVDRLPHTRRLHWTAAPLVFTPYALALLRSRRVDVLRGASVRYTGPALLLAKALARSAVPVVLHHHHLYPRWAALEARILARADAVITVSRHSRMELIKAGVPPERIHVIYEGVAKPRRTDGHREAWPETGLRLLHLGRLEARKRPEVAIDALASLHRSGERASLVIAGDGQLRGELEQRAATLGLVDSVRFLGTVSEQEKWRLYDSADVLLFASMLEGFGLVVAEAQSRGVPVVAAAGTATAEALDPGQSGLLTAPDGDAFAAAVKTLADPHTRKQMSERAARFARRFDWDACAEGVAQVYRELAQRQLR
jgi:glycosyltransferase involved in cell wall biosynthesis